MADIRVTRLSIYPIKSSAALQLEQSTVEARGLRHDRRFVVADADGHFLTGRTEPALTRIQAQPVASGLVLNAPDMPELLVADADLSDKRRPVTIWKEQLSARHCHPDYDRWLSELLGKPCQLLYCDEQTERSVEHTSDQPVGFADGYPLLLISQASLDDLNNRLATPVTMEHFRPNIVLDNTAAFAEDGWRRIRIGEVEFQVCKPCSRCIFTTRDPVTTELSPQREPLKTLASYRRGQDQYGDKGVFFGQNLIARNEGVIRQGDQVDILESGPAQIF